MDSQPMITQQDPATGTQPAEAPTDANTWGAEIDIPKLIARYREQHEEWLHDQERREADRKAMLEVIEDWEREHGSPTPEEMAKARAILGL